MSVYKSIETEIAQATSDDKYIPKQLLQGQINGAKQPENKPITHFKDSIMKSLTTFIINQDHWTMMLHYELE